MARQKARFRARGRCETRESRADTGGIVKKNRYVKDIAAVLVKAPQGVEVVVERDHRAVAVIKPSQLAGRMIARDVEEGIKGHREPWNPPSWD